MKSDSYVVPVRLSGFLNVGIILKSKTQTAMPPPETPFNHRSTYIFCREEKIGYTW